MAYTATKTSALQTAVKAGVDIAVAELGAGLITSHDDLMARIADVKGVLEAELFAQVDADNAAIAASPSPSYSRAPSGGGGAKTFTGPEAAGTELKFGAFKGLTFGQVYNLTEGEASAYSDGRYTKSGQDWLRWAAANKDPKGSFARKCAQAVLDNPPAP